jgi:hypothetical protein
MPCPEKFVDLRDIIREINPPRDKDWVQLSLKTTKTRKVTHSVRRSEGVVPMCEMSGPLWYVTVDMKSWLCRQWRRSKGSSCDNSCALHKGPQRSITTHKLSALLLNCIHLFPASDLCSLRGKSGNMCLGVPMLFHWMDRCVRYTY